MGQNQILKTIRLELFKDKELLALMGIPESEKNNLALFRDKYCVSGPLASNLVTKDIVARLVVSWGQTADTNNEMVAIRPLYIDVYVRRDAEYNASDNALERRQDLIINHIRGKLHNTKVNGFKLWVDYMADMTSNSFDYVRSFISFNMKYIF